MATIINDPKFQAFQCVITPGLYIGDFPVALPPYWWQPPRYETWTCSNTSVTTSG